MTTDQEYVIATYLVHGNLNFHKKAQEIAVGLTVGTWTDLPMARKEQMIPHLGKVIDVKVLNHHSNDIPKALLIIGYPLVNMNPDIPSILTTVFGKLSMDGKIKLIDLHLPDSLLLKFPGPRFGIDGIRSLLGVHDRPLLMSIFKQCIGLPLRELEIEYQNQIEGQVDLVKDDEIFFRDDYAPVLKRISAFEKRNQYQKEKNGKKVLYAVNLTGPVTQLVEQAKHLCNAGATCLLLNVAPYGFDILHRISADPDINIPIIAHPAFTGSFYPSPYYGLSAPLLLGKLMRLSGADIVLYPSPYGSVAMPKNESFNVAKELRCPNNIHNPAFPTPSAGIHPGLTPTLYRDLGKDFIINAGGGIHGHPQGTTAGGIAFNDAIQAVVSGLSLKEAAEDSPALRSALKKWGAL
ncbi:2,3-diketo-5-methylthiopentyl-1-phosphate enolase [Bacillus sp. ISL-34]|uniref:2,3-diketo-5-methylthiopentyl-1-phosphate enolase n=1 Tax=Bacillus sp. ISL-34 TaxID=2819121 RepID=UPI001BE7BE48|nr:2,3-diketo-5-methylthiopentyl-1-phosphate enolase [Bacillus sp. ISL-34]MBT2646291.1 2,3-diketo-5-methylthiopentyl-1-phosphate enolase [Bacillus sp. ISL-34]